MDSDDKVKPASSTTSPPPPYAPNRSLNLDLEDFTQITAKSPTTSFTARSVSSTNPNLLPTSFQPTVTKTPPTTPQTGDFAANVSNSQLESFQNDIFKKPPKFLLYPSIDESNQESGFKDMTPTTPKSMDEAVGHGQSHRAPAVFSVPATNPVQIEEPTSTFHPVDEFMPRCSHRAVCPHCRIPVITQTEYVNGTLTHLAALACCWLTGCCCCVPYFIDDIKDVEHYCPHCNNILGYNRKTLC